MDDDPRSGRSHIMLGIDLEIIEGIPDVPRELIQSVPFIVGGETPEELDALQEGKCLICGNTFGDETTVVVGADGIMAITDTPLCLDDHSILAYLQELATDVVQRVEFRGQADDHTEEDE